MEVSAVRLAVECIRYLITKVSQRDDVRTFHLTRFDNKLVIVFELKDNN